MKRSALVRLILMGSATLSITACDESPSPAGVFTSAQECARSGVYSDAACRNGLDSATRQHREVAPRFGSRQDCEADFGRDRCEEETSGRAAGIAYAGGRRWHPRMDGFMINQSGSSHASQPLYRPNVASNPAGSGTLGYVPGSFRTANNVEVGSRTGMTQVRLSEVGTPAPRTTTLSRGGFGARAASVATGS